jgi:hypothetical protein
VCECVCVAGEIAAGQKRTEKSNIYLPLPMYTTLENA